MKVSLLAYVTVVLLLLFGTVGQPLAQQSEADHKLFKEITEKAEMGDAQSQHELAEALFWGNLGLVKNMAEAVKWWGKAAEQNHPQAQFNLGVCYYNGNGLEQDFSEAVKWYRKAA